MDSIVLSSGGLDSTVVIAIAKDLGFDIISLSFDYNQRHKFELTRASEVAKFFGVKKHIILKVPLEDIGGSALTDRSIDVPAGKLNREGIPATYVPARNIIFLSYAVSIAEANNISDIFIGVNAIDFSNYPDCTPMFIESFQKSVNLGTKIGVEDKGVVIHTPLIKLGKSQIIKRGLELGVDFGITTSCYNPDNIGRPCGVCDSCLIRLKGFKDAGFEDPLIYKINRLK